MSKGNFANRFLALLLSLVMVATMIPVTNASAIDDGTDLNQGTDIIAAGENTDATETTEGNENNENTDATETTEGNEDNGDTEVVQTATLTVTLTGDATVEINGVAQNAVTVDIGTEVSVKITPAAKTYIKTLTVDGESVSVTKGESYEATIKVNADVAVEATVVKAFTVTVSADENGTVELNGQKVTSLSVDANTNVMVVVTAEEGYQIYSIAINGEALTLDSKTTFSHQFTVDADAEVTVAFVKVYTVTVTCNENGEVSITNPENAGGSVTVNEGTDVEITADPDDNYRVSEVKINDVADKNVPQKNYGSEDTYVLKLTADKSYEVVIKFELNRYSVTAAPAEHGNVEIEHADVAYGGSTKVTVKPETGYTIKSVKVGDAEVSKRDDENATFEITNITEDKVITVVFAEVTQSELADISFNSEEAVKTDAEKNQYVFANDATVTFVTNKFGIKINGKGNIGTNTIEIEKNTEITSIQLFYLGQDEWAPYWHDVKLDKPIRIVIDKTGPEITGEPDRIYNDAFSFDVSVTDELSDVASVVYQYGDKEQQIAENKGDGKYTIVVDKRDNVTEEIEVTVTAKDTAKNETVKEITFQMDTVAPEVTVEFSNNNARNEKYFKEARTITVTYVEENFNHEKAEAGLNLLNDTGKVTWTWSADKHTAVIELGEDENGSYSFALEYADEAGNPANVTFAEGSIAYDQFVIDVNDAPTGEVSLIFNYADGTVKGSDELPKYTALEAEDALVYHLWANKEIIVTAAADDELSGIEAIDYYIDYYANAEDLKLLDEAHLENIKGWIPYSEITVNDNSRFVVYFRITDMAGNVHYISTNGLILDNKKPSGAVDKEIDISVSHDKDGETELIDRLYGKDDKAAVEVKIKVYDPKFLAADADKNGAFSGLSSITCTVNDTQIVLYGEGAKAVAGLELASDSVKVDLDEKTNLVYYWEGTLLVDKETFNSNNVSVNVVAVDNATNAGCGNTELAIDVTLPEIQVVHQNNAVDSGKYFKNSRGVKIVVTERNFDENRFSFVYMMDEKPVLVNGVDLDWEPVIAESGNGDDNTHTADYTFGDDADYLLGRTDTIRVDDEGNVSEPYFVFADLADNSYCYASSEPSEVVGVQFTGEAPDDFTIDTKAPEVEVTYNNNSAKNGKYFDARRTATVTITEHNFPFNEDGSENTDRVDITITRPRGGADPAITWAHKGDVHVATIEYKVDGDYTFDIDVTDMAGNDNRGEVDYKKSAAPQEFVIDTTYQSMVTITDVENGKAYGYDAELVPSIRISDINLDEYDLSLVGVQMDKTIDLTSKAKDLMKEGEETVSGLLKLFEKEQNLDGIYTLKVSGMDKAGNQDVEQVTFTVNRFGSVYVFEDYLMDLVKDGGAFVQAVTEDLVFTEYNADKLLADSVKVEITVDGKPLENVKFDISPEVNDQVSIGSSGWYQYKYTLSKENFTADGVYKISVSSKDATGNAPQNSNYEDRSMTFRVDSTKSELTSIVGLEKPIINAQEITVKYTVFDTIGIKKIQVYVNGSLVDEITDFTADPNNFESSFLVREANTAQSVRLVVEDLAGNITDTDAKDFAPMYAFNGDITVSTNIFVRWYANKGLFWGSIGGVVLIAALVVFFLAKKKKEN